MKYLCLVHAAPTAFDNLSKAQSIALTDDSLDYDAELRSRGHLLHAQALQPPESAVIIRVRDGRMSSSDGPFAETREQLAGFILIEARDLSEAMELAAGIPMARVGAIEVRPIAELEHS